MQYSDFEKALAKHVLLRPLSVALQSDTAILNYAQLQQAVATLRQNWSLQSNTAPVAMAVNNHPAWVVLDIAALGSEIILVPIPFFFSDAQILHAVMDAGVNTFITDEPERFDRILSAFIVRKNLLSIASKNLTQFDLQVPTKVLPDTTAKITYTSGTTGNPKGICLSAQAMLNVAYSVANATRIDGEAHHLCVLPLSTLLENVAGVYAALIAGATIHLLSSSEIGLSGNQLDSIKLYDALAKTQANTAIFLPELLNGLIAMMESGAAPLPHLQFLAVGGAAVSTHLLLRAKKLALPVYQGYGLSECASVVALNTAYKNKIGSVGKPLPHVEVKLADDGEILVKDALFLGYTGDKYFAGSQEWLPTGDIGTIDQQGYLQISGRKKHIFITSFGRNVSPEWVECALLNSPHIMQACVFGEAKPWNVALIVPKPGATDAFVSKEIDEINLHLPDYARIRKWVAVIPFTRANQQLTPNARLKRAEIYQTHQQIINNLYKEVA